jgi:CheY-like chemotaxis protein
MKTLSILVADDEPSLRRTFVAMLARAGHRTTTAANSASALDSLAREHFDVILTDMMLEESDGLEVIQAARQLQPDARIIAMSAGGRYLRPEFCLELARAFGACTTLPKPFSYEQLMVAVEGNESAPLAPDSLTTELTAPQFTVVPR